MTNETCDMCMVNRVCTAEVCTAEELTIVQLSISIILNDQLRLGYGVHL